MAKLKRKKTEFDRFLEMFESDILEIVSDDILIVNLTPDMAHYFLERNDKNRPVAREIVKRLARQISAGEWDLNGHSIKTGVEMDLFDGQHRCQAVILANKSIRTYLHMNLDRKMFDTIDTGKSRDNKDVISMKFDINATDAKMLRTAVSFVENYEANTYYNPCAARIDGFDGSVLGRKYKFTNKEAIAEVEKRPEFFDTLTCFKSRKINRSIFDISKNLLFSVYHVCRLIDPDLADFMLDTILERKCSDPDGEMIIDALNHIVVERKKHPGAHYFPVAQIILTMTWNALRKGRTLSTFKSGFYKKRFLAFD